MNHERKQFKRTPLQVEEAPFHASAEHAHLIRQIWKEGQARAEQCLLEARKMDEEKRPLKNR